MFVGGTECVLTRQSRQSVLVDAKQTDTVELWKLGQKHKHQGDKVDCKMCGVVFGVEVGDEKPEGIDKRLENLVVKDSRD